MRRKFGRRLYGDKGATEDAGALKSAFGWIAGIVSFAKAPLRIVRDVFVTERSPFFDKQSYREQLTRCGLTAKWPAYHYARIGWKQGLNPGPLFRTSAYMTRHPWVSTNPLVHFVRHGMREGLTGWSENEVIAWQGDLIHNPEQGLSQIAARHGKWPVLRRGDTVIVHAHSRGHFVFRLFQEMLVQAFNAAGVDCISADERPVLGRNRPATRIIIAPHDFYYLDNSPAPGTKEFVNSIPLNSEQMPSAWFAKAWPFIVRARFVLDINPQTAVSLARLGVNARFLPLGIVPENEIFRLQATLPDEPALRDLPPSAAAAPSAIDAPLGTREIDILMIGSSSDRRQRFFADNAEFFAGKNCFLRLVQVTGALDLSDDQAISPRAFAGLAQRSKILLNVHHFEMPYFEWQRLMHFGLMQCCCVVTERASRVPGVIPGVHYFEDELNKLPALMAWLLNEKDGRERLDAVRRAGYAAAVAQFQLRRSLCELFGLPL